MSFNNYVIIQPLPQVTLTALQATPQTFLVNALGMDTLILDMDLTHVDGTAVVITLRSEKGFNDATNNRTFLVTDYSAKTLTDATFTWTIGASARRIATFSLTGIGLTESSVGNLQVAVSRTGGTTDSMVITPAVARTA
jgi:hypothetical protein